MRSGWSGAEGGRPTFEDAGGCDHAGPPVAEICIDRSTPVVERRPGPARAPAGSEPPPIQASTYFYRYDRMTVDSCC